MTNDFATLDELKKSKRGRFGAFVGRTAKSAGRGTVRGAQAVGRAEVTGAKVIGRASVKVAKAERKALPSQIKKTRKGAQFVSKQIQGKPKRRRKKSR